ncbi:MAG: hypothetical protein IKX76_05340 [Eubacterium sp.]|nr:hypothetical protein [Eubacterium sp.]
MYSIPPGPKPTAYNFPIFPPAVLLCAILIILRCSCIQKNQWSRHRKKISISSGVLFSLTQ